MRLAKSSGSTNILPETSLRKQVREAAGEGEANQSGSQAGFLPVLYHAPTNLLFCRGFREWNVSRLPRRKNNLVVAHDWLQLPVKNEDGIFQTHRQAQALV